MSIPEFYRQFAPTSTAETFEERKRRKEQEELVEMQSTISVPETTIETPKTQEANIPEFYRQFSPTPKETIVEEKQESTIPEFYRQFKQKEPTDLTTLPAPVKYDRAYSLDDLDNDEYFQKRANRFLESIGTDEDIYETLRDSDWSITDALARAYDSGKWTEQQKADYKYLRNTFDKAEVGGLGHILEATKDIAIDIVADPLNLIAGLFIVGSGGAGVAGATAVSRIAASQAIKTGAKKLANQKGFRAVSMGLTEGAYDAGLINVGTQLTEIQTGVRQAGTEFSMTEAGVSAGLGATAGATLVGGAHKLANYMLRKEHDKLVKTYDLDAQLKNEAGEISSEAVSEFKSNVKFMDKITSQTVGKPLTEFIEDAKNSDIMKQLLLNFRHDTFRRIFSARSEKIDVANMTFSRDAEKTSNTYAVFVKKALQKLEYGKEGDTFLRRFFNPNLKLTEENDLAIWSLLARGNTLDKYMTVTPVDINKPLHSVNTKTLQPIHSPTQASGIPKGNRLSKEEFQFLRQYNVNQLEAAAKIRYFLKQAHKEASDIEAVDPKSGKLITESPVYEGGKIAQISLESIKESNPDRYSRIYNQKKAEDPSKTRKEIDQTNIEKVVPFSLFKTGQELDNYLPRKYIGKVMKEKEDIFVPALAKTSHALPKSQPKIEEKVLVDSVQNHIGTAGRERKYLPDPSTGEKVKVYKNEITEDQEYFFNFKTKNLPHIKERVARGENIDDIDAEFIFKRYDSFEDMAIAEINNTIEGTLDLNKLTAEQWDKITEIASGYKAKAVFDEFLKKETDPVYRKTLNDFYAENKIGKTEFLNPRIWNELDDKFLIDNGFIQTDAAAILEDYAWKLGHKINEEKYFGYGSNYVFRYLEPIREELIEKGYEPVKAKELTEKLLKARDYATGGRYANTDLSDLQRGLYDGIKVSQILAHLPFATLSSITEPLIALGRSDLADTPAFVKEFGKGIIKSGKKSAQRFYNHMEAARGKKVRGFKDLSDEDWLDAYRAGVATEQAMMTKIEGMFAEGMQTGRAKNIINAFFNINFLQQWTQGVQLGAFNYAKERSIRILGELAEDKNVYGIQLTTNSRSRRADQLREIGIDPKQGVAAYRRAIDEDGVFNKETFKEDPFYDTEFTAAAALFSKEIILNPSAAELNKPMWFNSPGTGILVQFAGYPTAFNNTVLKGFARDVIRHPMANAPKVIAASGMMAGTATLMNWLRSGGESLKNRKDTEIILQSFERPGLLGWLQYPLRYYEGTQYGAGFIGSGLKSVSGPFVGDVVDGIAYRQPWFLALGTNLPGYGALSPQAKRDFKDMLRRTFDKKESDPRLRRAKGGEVIGVPNVKEEPDEAKMRGLPYTYSELAGPLFQDEEERGAFAEGGKASIKETDEAYAYITKDEDAYNIQLNKNPIDVYTEEELPELEVKDTYYTGFKGNTVSDRLNSVRQSRTIGLPVTKDKTKARGGVKASGKIKFKNVLKLDIDSVTPDSVQAEINKNIDSIIKIEDKVLAKEIVKATNDNLAIRDDIFNNDPNKTPEKKRVVERSKSFLVRQQLLKLSYDAIETKEGYTLLRENQFLPTEIMNRRQTGFSGGLAKRILNKIDRTAAEVARDMSNEKIDVEKKSSDISPREFFEREQENWESDHGSIPVPTNDAGEQHLPIEERTKDIGFGHKITPKEMEAGVIHGIPFINKETGEFIDLTIKDKRFIKKQDNLTLVARARAEGWDKKLQERGLSWEAIPDKYKLPLEDIAFNVKDPQQWNNIFDEIKNDNVARFVKNLRRQDAGKNTAGMDNRAAKAAAASGLITSYEQALDYGLELTTERRLPFLSKIFERQQYNEGGESYGDVIVQDYKEELQGLKDMLTDPVGMIDSIGQLGLGAIALAIPDEYQERKLDQYEDLAKGVGQSLVDNFGTLEKAKQTIINNPVGTAAAVSGLLFGGGFTLKKIADAAKVSKGSQAGSKMIKASDAIDPIIGPILGAGKLITRRDFNKGVGATALASAIPASKVLDEVDKAKTIKKLTGISKFRNIYDNIGYALKGSKQRDMLIDELTNETLKDKIPMHLNDAGIEASGNLDKILEYGDAFEAQSAIARKIPEIGYEALTSHYKRTRKYYTGTKTTDILNNFQKSFKLNNNDFVEIYPERLKIDTKKSKLNNTIKELINSFNKTSNKKTYKNVEEFGDHPFGEDYSEITKVTTAVIEGVPVIKVEAYSYYPSGHRNWSAEEFKKSQFVKPETTSHPEFKKTNYEKTDEIYYIPNESGLEKLANPTKTITKRDMLTGLRDRNNKGGEIRQQYGVGGIASKLAQRLLKKQSKKYNLAESQKTQIATTGGTYKKAAKIKEEYNKKTALDYGSGMQVKSAKQFLNADTFEPYPKEKYQMPDFTDPKFINKKYDFITNFSVLNVLPKDSRDLVVKDIGRLLDDKGIAVITARSKKDVVTEQTKKNAQQIISDSEIITKKGTYQKGFTQEELKSYLNKTLGKDFEVIELPNIYKMSGIGALVKRK